MKIKALKFEFSYKTKSNDSFRCKSLLGQYDLENKDVVQCFSGDYLLPEQWNIGLIVGNSGSGKTSIARNCFDQFSDNTWSDKPLIDNFNESLSMSEITNALGSVGFNSVPYWLKPYHVLSNGEKSRVDLARMALERDLTVFDEFTSLVDRDVAKSMSNSVQHLYRKLNKKLVAVTCHHDVLEWLTPDWVYDTDKKEFSLPKSLGANSSNLTYIKSKQIDGIFISSIII